jgi:hypothetical protein
MLRLGRTRWRRTNSCEQWPSVRVRCRLNIRKPGIVSQAYGQFLKHIHRKSESSAVTARANCILVRGLRESGAGYTVEASMLLGK